MNRDNPTYRIFPTTRIWSATFSWISVLHFIKHPIQFTSCYALPFVGTAVLNGEFDNIEHKTSRFGILEWNKNQSRLIKTRNSFKSNPSLVMVTSSANKVGLTDEATVPVDVRLADGTMGRYWENLKHWVRADGQDEYNRQTLEDCIVP